MAKKLTYIALTILLLWVPKLRAEQQDSLIVSLVTCWPGREVYELDGHSAIRVRNASGSLDEVYNYGVFDFNEPNFVYRFVKGETDYMLGAYPFQNFMPEYLEARRKVLEQELNLTQEEAKRFVANLELESRPENRMYRYNYVLDNCATRITMRLDQAIGGKIQFPDTVAYGTFRNEMRHFHRDYPWYQFGIDLCLGIDLDLPLEADYEMFVPIVMAKRYSEAKLPDGRPLVKSYKILNQGVENASLPATPWYLTPLFVCWLVAFIAATLALWMLKKNKTFRIAFSVWFLLIGILGCISFFLVFFSSHYATSPNLLILWLNPLQLIIGLGIWWRRWRLPVRIVTWLDLLLVGILMLAWPFQAQSANPAFFPMMLTTLLLAVTYTILDYRNSYIKKEKSQRDEKTDKRSYGRRGQSKRVGGTGVRRQAQARGRNSR